MPSHTPVLASLLLACVLAACGGAESRSTSTHDTNARAAVEKPLPDGDADASAAGLDGSRRTAAQGGYTPFVLDGYEVLGAEPGDLNKDAYPDVVLALKIAGEEDVKTEKDFGVVPFGTFRYEPRDAPVSGQLSGHGDGDRAAPLRPFGPAAVESRPSVKTLVGPAYVHGDMIGLLLHFRSRVGGL